MSRRRDRLGAGVALLLALLTAWWATRVPLPPAPISEPPPPPVLTVRTPSVPVVVRPPATLPHPRFVLVDPPRKTASEPPPPLEDWPDFDFRPCHTVGLHPDDALAVQEFQRRHGICLRFEGRKNAAMETEPLDDDYVPWALDLAAEWIAPYPPELVPDVVDEVRFVDEEKDDASHVLGSAECARRSMVVVVNEKRLHAGVLETMHHELAHLLVCAYPLDRKAWAATSKLPYVGGSKAFRSGKGERRSLDELHEAGFVGGYAQASFQEDVAETYELVTGDPDKATQLAARFPVLDAKLRLLEDWARSLPGEVVLPTDPRPASDPGTIAQMR